MLTAAGSGFSRWNGLERHPLARGHDAGLLGHVRLPARHAHRRGVVGGLPAERSRSGPLRRRVLRGSGQDHAARPFPRHHARGRGVARRRRRAPPVDGDERREPGPRDRLHFLCRGRAGSPRRGRGAPRLLEPLRGDGVRARGGDAAGDTAPALRGRAAGLARSRGRDRRRAGGADAVRERPRALPRPGPRDPVAALRERRGTALEHGGSGARPHREPSAAAGDSARPDGPPRLHDARGAVPRRGARDRAEVSPAGHVRTGELAGLDAGAGPAAPPAHQPGRGASLPASRQSSPLRGSLARARRRRCWPRTASTLPVSGPTASPATFPSPWFASSGTKSATSSASCCGRESIGA